jgi:6-phosphogluconolactonase
VEQLTAIDSAQPRQICRWHSYPDRTALNVAAAEFILAGAAHAITARGVFHIVLAGGATPREVYGLLRERSTDWSAWRVYFGDERCVPVDDPERNSSMALATLFAHVSVAHEHFYAIPAERGARVAANEYAALLARVPTFDLVLLGLGEDGHTASLFPGMDIGQSADAPAVLPVFDAPKPPPERVSLSAARLSRTHQALFIVSGASKRAAIQRWRAGVDIPASHVVPAGGVDIILEAALLE